MLPQPPASVVLEDDREHLVHPLQFAADHQRPLVFVRGQGATLTDIEGNEYLDGLSCLWNVNVGHGRTELAQAAARQMEQLAFASNYVGSVTIPSAELAARLVALAYPNMRSVYFTTSGAESNESAFKTARFFWKVNGKPDKVKFISRVHGYHGVTMAAASATGLAAYHRMFAPLVPNFIQAPPPYPYRWAEYGGQGGDPGIEAADAIEQIILREGPETVAAVIAEPVQGAGGVIVPPDSYFPRLREICDRHDVLLIADEIITGFCRTGRWFALDHWGVQPDIVSFAKGVTSGYLPLGGIMLSDRVHAAILDAPADLKYMHAATYSGHPTCCAVGLANLDIMEREQLADAAATKGARFLENLQTLAEHPNVGDVRGLGMMCGIELVEDKATKAPAIGLGGRVLAEARTRGLIPRLRGGARGDAPIGDIICLAPPLITTDEELDRIVAILRDSLAAATA
ncbi:MAG: Omega-amino acid--pyruvate aminotransferase [Ktedonobacterales bacterium]|jgi:adenosylmethionine-8-amino-7-oxononanoate aminotransferase|nr:MAG: Omega-amino acid--pyruvate aminotransferase [Ktedonobacterales bacterium]